jgi:acyl-CoA thioester hydrolase
MSAAGPHRYALRVYFEDTDAGGIVYHASYLRFAERARTEALRDLGIPHAELMRQFNLMFVVRRVKLDYLRPARLDDSLLVLTAPLHVGGARVVLRQVVVPAERETERLVEAEVHLVCIRPGGERPARLPPAWREGMASLGWNGS